MISPISIFSDRSTLKCLKVKCDPTNKKNFCLSYHLYNINHLSVTVARSQLSHTWMECQSEIAQHWHRTRGPELLQVVKWLATL